VLSPDSGNLILILFPQGEPFWSSLGRWRNSRLETVGMKRGIVPFRFLGDPSIHMQNTVSAIVFRQIPYPFNGPASPTEE
jgi:hypothetical protein